MSLAVISTHPIQYYAPIYRAIQKKFGIPVTAIYGSDFSIVGYKDEEFNTTFAWDTDLLAGYQSIFLSKVMEGGARSLKKVSIHGFRDALKKARPKAVLLTGYSPRFHMMAFWEVIRGLYPILFRGETTDHAQSRNFLKKYIRDHTLRSLYQRCGKLLYVGKRSYQHFIRLSCPKDKLFFSPYCVDTAPFKLDEVARKGLREEARQNLRIDERRKVIIFSGKLVKRKGVTLLLEAVKNLSPAIRMGVTILFLGDGELKGELEHLAKKLPEVKVHFLGFQNQTRLSLYYHASDLMVLPSRYSETWGLVVNEALHHGLPCVVSEAVGCAPDLIESHITGEIFKTGSSKSLALALERALTLVNRADIRERCREKVSGYTVEKAAEGIAKAYRSIV